MVFTARVTRASSGFCAECAEVDVVGEGPTRDAAVASLRAELLARSAHVEGVALPEKTAPAHIDIVILDEPKDTPPAGPGDPA